MKPEVVFKAMADQTRQRTLRVLTPNELTVSELVEVLRQPQSTVSRHLRVLREAGLIRDRREGNAVLYSVQPSAATLDGAELTGRMLEWVAGQPLPPPQTPRLDAVHHRPREMSDRFFNRIGRHWDSLREESFGNRFHLEAFWALLPRRWVVADIGTGTGYLLVTLARYFSRVVGVDPVDTMLEAARQRVEELRLGNRVELRQGDLSRLPISGATVDLAVAVLVLHHVASPPSALAELYRILRAGGTFLVVEQTAHEREDFRDRMQDRWWGFEAADLGGQLEAMGFEEVRSQLLTTVERDADAPELFVVTGRKATA